MIEQTGAAAIGARLRGAIERRCSIRAFVAAMQARGVRGSTYPTVNAYLKGESEPSISFLVEAGEELGVSPQWLAFGVSGAAECAACAVREDRVRRAVALLTGEEA